MSARYSINRAHIHLAPEPAVKHTKRRVPLSALHGSVICPKCDKEVPLRQDGTIWSHRSGTRQYKNSWPCIAGGTFPPPTEETP